MSYECQSLAIILLACLYSLRWPGQREMRLARGYYSSLAEAADFVGESAALNAKVVGESLSVKRNVKLTRAYFFGRNRGAIVV